MSREFDEIMRDLEAEAKEQSRALFEPIACYNSDGDCLEFHLSNENYRGQRIDRWLTVFIGEDSGDFVGGVLKSVKSVLVQQNPGIGVDTNPETNRLPLTAVLRVAAHDGVDATSRSIYRKLMDNANQRNVETDLLSLS